MHEGSGTGMKLDEDLLMVECIREVALRCAWVEKILLAECIREEALRCNFDEQIIFSHFQIPKGGA